MISKRYRLWCREVSHSASNGRASGSLGSCEHALQKRNECWRLFFSRLTGLFSHMDVLATYRLNVFQISFQICSSVWLSLYFPVSLLPAAVKEVRLPSPTLPVLTLLNFHPSNAVLTKVWVNTVSVLVTLTTPPASVIVTILGTFMTVGYCVAAKVGTAAPPPTPTPPTPAPPGTAGAAGPFGFATGSAGAGAGFATGATGSAAGAGFFAGAGLAGATGATA